jgi:hypothetical protein
VLPSSEHAVPLALGAQVPMDPAMLHAEHSPVQLVSQQTPLTQNPETHWLALVHDTPLDGS